MPLIRSIRAAIYDTLIVHLTADWYRAVLERLPAHCHFLDVGIGTGSALLANANLLTDKDLRVTGIDIDADYVERCRNAVENKGLSDRIDARLESVYDHRGGPYGAAYFSGSFMLLPDPQGALRHVVSLLQPDGRVYFTQTFEHTRSPVMERIKPVLKWLTTIDFGRVTYEADFRAQLAEGGLEVEAREVLQEGKRRSWVLVVARGQLAQPYPRIVSP